MFYDKNSKRGGSRNPDGIVWDHSVHHPSTEYLMNSALEDLDADIASGLPTLSVVWLMDTHFSYNVPAAYRHTYHGGPPASLELYRASIRATDTLVFQALRPRWERHVNAGNLIFHFGSDHGDQFQGERHTVMRGHDTLAGPLNTVMSAVGVSFFPVNPYSRLSTRAQGEPLPKAPAAGYMISVGSNMDVLPTILDYLGVGDETLPLAVYSAGTSWLRPRLRRPWQIVESLGPLEYRTKPPAVILMAHARKYRVLLRECPVFQAPTKRGSLRPAYCGQLTHAFTLDDQPLVLDKMHRQEANSLMHIHHCRTRGCCLQRGDVADAPCGTVKAPPRAEVWVDPVPERFHRLV